MMASSDLAVSRGTSGRLRFLEAVLDSAVDYAIIGLDLDGTIIEWTEGARRILGWGADEMIGRHASAFFSPEDVADEIPATEMRGAREQGRASDERWHLHKDGTRFYALGEMMPLRDEAGALVGYIKILRDRTQQKLAEDALRDREAFLTSVLSSSGDCIKILDLDGRLSFMTEIGQRVMEVADFNALCGLFWPTLWESAGRAEAETAVVVARAGGVGRFQGFCPTMKGTPKHWDVVVTPIRDVDGKVAKLLAVSARHHRHARRRDRARRGRDSVAVRLEPAGGDLPRGADRNLRLRRGDRQGDDPQRHGQGHAGHPADGGGVGSLSRLRRAARRRPRLRARGLSERPRARAGRAGGLGGHALPQTRRGRGAPLRSEQPPVRDAEGKLLASVTILVDATAEREAKAEAAKLAALVEQSSDCITITALGGRLDYVNPAGLALLGLPDLASAQQAAITAAFAAQCQTTLETETFPAVARSGHWEGELRLLSAAGERTPVLHTAFPLRDATGAVTAYGGVTRDLTAQKAAEKRQTMLNHELSHRMKNMLAMVQSIAFQTLRSAPSVAVARETLSARIVALSKAHDLLLEDTAEAADLRAIAAAAVAPHDEEDQPRFALDGPAVSVGPRAAMALSLMLHELATNAAKYGALSAPAGRVAIAWQTIGPRFELRWRESEGPPVTAPTRLGFGSRLIERGLAADVGGKVVVAYPPDGVICTVNATLASLQAGA